MPHKNMNTSSIPKSNILYTIGSIRKGSRPDTMN